MANYPLNILTEEEKKVLFKIFHIKKDEKSEKKLDSKLGKLLLPVGGIFQTKLTYEETIEKIAEKNEIDLPVAASIATKEGHLFINLFSKSFNNLNEVEKQEFLDSLSDKGLSKDQIASITALTGIGAAQLSGFGVYLLASSTVAAITSALGITLSFAFYTAMASIIKVAIGPVGFVLAAIPLFKTFKNVRSLDDLKNIFNSIYSEGKNFVTGNYKSAELIIQYFASLRIMKMHQLESELSDKTQDIAEMKKSIANLIEEKEKTIARLISIDRDVIELENKIDELKKERENLTSIELSNNRNEKDRHNIIVEHEKEIEHLKMKLELLKND